MSITVGDAALWLRAKDDHLDGDLAGAEGKARGWVGRVGGFLGNAMSVAVGGLIQQGIGAITGQIGALAQGMIGGNAQFEQYNTQFTVLLGSSEKAQQRMDALAKFGASTPFDLPQVVEADRILQGFGLHSDEAAKKFGFSGEQIRTIAGDVASGTGSSFQEMSLLIGKFSAGATGEAMARMAELGITNRDELTKMGLQFDKSGSLLTPLPKAMETVLGLMKTKYGGLMDAQSKTFEGMRSNLQDWVGNALRTIGKPLFETLKDKLGVLLEFLGSPAVQKGIEGFANFLANGIGRGIDMISRAADGLQSGPFMDVMRGLGSLVQNLFAGNTLNALGDLSLVITTVFTSIGQALGMGEADAQAFGMTVDGLVSQVLTVIQGVIGFVTTTVLPVLSWLATAAIGAFQQIWATVQTVWPQIQTIIATYLNGIWTVVQQVIGIVVQFWQINGSQIIATGQQIWSTVLGTVQAVLPQIQSIVQSVMGFITQFMTDHGAEIQMILQQAWFTISMAVGLAVQIVQATIVPAFQAVAGFLQTHSAEIQAVINTVWGVISQVIWTAMTVIQGVIQAISAAIQGDWTGFGLALRGIWDETIGRLVSAVQEIDWLATGKSIIEGLGNGMGAMAGWLSEAAVNVAKNALSAIKAFFGIKSPSTVMADQVGAPMAMGIGAGFSQALAGLQPAFAVDMQNVVTALRPAPAVAGSRNVTINLHLPAGTPVETQQAARRGAEEAWRAAAAEIGMQLE